MRIEVFSLYIKIRETSTGWCVDYNEIHITVPNYENAMELAIKIGQVMGKIGE